LESLKAFVKIKKLYILAEGTDITRAYMPISTKIIIKRNWQWSGFYNLGPIFAL